MTKERLAEIETYLKIGYSSPILRELLDALKESEARVGKLREALELALSCDVLMRLMLDDTEQANMDALLTETAPDNSEDTIDAE